MHSSNLVIESKDDSLNPPGILISQQVNGVKVNDHFKTLKNLSDNGNSRIYGTSFYARYQEGKSIPTSKKTTDDKIVIGYTCSGLPFQIVVDGFYGGETTKIFEFIDTYVTPLMDEYAEQLSESENPKETICSLVETIYALREQHSPYSVFTLSIGITYEKNNHLKCAGFGIGNTGLVLRRSNGDIQQLAHTTFVDGLKDAFDDTTMQIGIRNAIDRNSLFDVDVGSGDEIFGYTSLHNKLLLTKPTYANEQGNNIAQQLVDSENLEFKESLFDTLIEFNSRYFVEDCLSATKQKETKQFGDDCMMGTVIIPTPALRNQLQKEIYHQEKATLDSLERTHANKDIQSKGAELQRTLTILADNSSNLPELTRQLAASNRALAEPNKKNLHALLTLADKAQGKSSSAWKAVGIAMMAFGLVLAIIGGVVLAGGLGASFSGTLTLPGAAGVALGTGLATSGVAMLLVGYGIFKRNNSRTGVLKDMLALAVAAESDAAVQHHYPAVT